LRYFKINIITAILFFAFCNSVISQGSKGYGFKGGISFSNLNIDNTDLNNDIQTVSKPGISAGLFLDIYKTGKFSLFSELAYNQSINDIKIYSKDISGNEYLMSSVNYKVDYLNYSLNIKYEYSEGIFKPYVYAGPRLSFYLNDGSPANDSEIPGGLKVSIHDNLKKFIFSAAICIGIEIKIAGKTSVFGESSYSPGLFKSYEDGVVSAKINSLEVKAGFRFLY
jgi:hypothetical protein